MDLQCLIVSVVVAIFEKRGLNPVPVFAIVVFGVVSPKGVGYRGKVPLAPPVCFLLVLCFVLLPSAEKQIMD